MTPENSLTFADRGSSAGEPGSENGRTGRGRAHGKAILLGEHAVVYGAPAVAIPIPQLTATATARRWPADGGDADHVSFAMAGSAAPLSPLATDGLQRLVTAFKERAALDQRICVDVLIDCTIPAGRGLGSSAACARAVVLALADAFERRLDARAVFDVVQISEKVAHGRASGIDAHATGATSPIVFSAGDARDLESGAGFDGLFVIADSGVGASTRDAVELLWRRFQRDAGQGEAFVREVADLTRAAVADLVHGRVAELGPRLTENHRLLQDVGVSTDRIDALVAAALAGGSLGAKLSGGGLGGCIVALASGPGRAEDVVRSLHDAGAARTWVVAAGRRVDHAH